MTNPFDLIIQEFKDRNAADYNKFPPFFIASIGCHYFNLINQQEKIYQRAGIVENTRLNVIMVAPQGQQKTFWLRQFLDPQNSILKDTAIKTDFEMRLTEPGYMGSKNFGKDRGQIIESEGLCVEEATSIIGIEEMSDIMKSVDKQDYNIGFDNALLTTLDNGYGYKRMAAGKIEFQTHLTIWAGTQPGRFNLVSGLGRRFLFLFNIPTEQSINDLRERRRSSIHIQTDPEKLQNVKLAINKRLDEITLIQSVEFSKDFYDLLDTFHLMQFEEILYEKLALGYTIMKADILNPNVVVKMDSTLRKMMIQEFNWRRQIKRGTEDSMVWSYVQSAAPLHYDRCTDVLLDFGMKLDEAEKSIRTLHKKNLIKIEKGMITLVEKKPLYIPEPEQMEQEILE